MQSFCAEQLCLQVLCLMTRLKLAFIFYNKYRQVLRKPYKHMGVEVWFHSFLTSALRIIQVCGSFYGRASFRSGIERQISTEKERGELRAHFYVLGKCKVCSSFGEWSLVTQPPAMSPPPSYNIQLKYFGLVRCCPLYFVPYSTSNSTVTFLSNSGPS
jgi:hypothetical protein